MHREVPQQNKLWISSEFEKVVGRVWWKLWVNDNRLLNEPLNRHSRCFNGSTFWPAGILTSMKPKRLDQHYYSTFIRLCRSDRGMLERVHVWRSKDGSKMWPQFSATGKLQYRGYSSLLWQMFFLSPDHHFDGSAGSVLTPVPITITVAWERSNRFWLSY